MCGICYAKSLCGNNVNQIIRQQYKNQRGRGYEGFGFISRVGERSKIFRDTTEEGIIKKLKSESPHGTIIYWNDNDDYEDPKKKKNETIDFIDD